MIECAQHTHTAKSKKDDNENAHRTSWKGLTCSSVTNGEPEAIPSSPPRGVA
jgi:hypothetical protein